MANRLKEDEKNERIIRNLLKLPENRRCINCNSLGPQYVCTNFSTFICTTCSGIHREFTHRVKSVSMAKFTPQEVSSLQGGGNASAREIYLKEWDYQRNSLPDSSNTERLRDFIKHIYVDRRYTGERSSEKSLRTKMGETEDFSGNRRIDNNQGGSRSPPYEETLERRQDRASVGGRSPGYDQDNKQTGDYRQSPLRGEVVNDWRREDRFGNGRRSDDGNSDGSSKLGGRSPDSQRDSDMSSPPVIRPVRDILGENVTPLRVIEPPPKVSSVKPTDGSSHSQNVSVQRPASSSSLASSEGNPSVIKLEASFIDFDSAPEPVVAATIPQTQHSATNPAPVQHIASSDNNWANFDSVPEVKVQTPVPNSVESLLSELSIEVSTSGPPASASKSSPFRPSGSEGSSLGSTYGSVASPLLFPSDGTSSFANAPTGGQWPIPNSHQDSVFPGASGLSVPQPVATISVTSSGKPLNPLVNPISYGHPGAPISHAGQAVTNPSMGSAFGFSSEPTLQEKSGGRRELPADLFTMTNSYFPPPVSGWYSGSPYVARVPMHYNMPMAVPNFQQVPRSMNPFDSTNERPPFPAPTFPSVASLHGSVPRSAPASGLLRTSSLGTPASFPSSMHTQPPLFAQSIPSTPFFGQEVSGSTAHRPFGPNQQFGGLQPAHSAPGNLTSADGNPFG